MVVSLGRFRWAQNQVAPSRQSALGRSGSELSARFRAISIWPSADNTRQQQPRTQPFGLPSTIQAESFCERGAAFDRFQLPSPQTNQPAAENAVSKRTSSFSTNGRGHRLDHAAIQAATHRGFV